MIEIKDTEIISKTDSVSDESLKLTHQSLAELRNIQTALDASKISRNDYLSQINDSIQLSNKKLSSLAQNASEQENGLLLNVNKILNEIKTSISKINPKVKNEMILDPLEKLLRTELGKIQELIESSKIEKLLEESNKLLTAIKDKKSPMFIGGGGGYIDTSNLATISKQDDIITAINNSTLTPILDYDYLDVQQTDADTETYIYKLGGSGGNTVRTIIVNYTDSTKNNIDNVSWT